MLVRPAVALSVAAVLCIAAHPAHAQDGDGLYGRWDHDVHLVLNAGAGVVTRQPGGQTRLAVDVDAAIRFVGAAGPLVGVGFRGASEVPSVGLIGMSMRPLFPGIFLRNMSTGREVLDLTLQSIFVELAFALHARAGGLERAAGFVWGGGFELPLVKPRGFSQGLWLRFTARRFTAARGFARANPARRPGYWTVTASLALSLGVGHGRTASWEPPRSER